MIVTRGGKIVIDEVGGGVVVCDKLSIATLTLMHDARYGPWGSDAVVLHIEDRGNMMMEMITKTITVNIPITLGWKMTTTLRRQHLNLVKGR